MRSFAVVAGCALLLAACAEPGGAPAPQSTDARIADYAQRIAEHPRVYATYLGLAQAYLDKARETHDAAYVAKARAAAQTSMDIMPGLEGLKMQARIAAFRHHFDEALEWAKQAQALLSADVTDGGVTALLVEAHMGLKQFDEARALLPPDGARLPDFHTAAAMGHWLKSQKRLDEAAAAFETASGLALNQNQKTLAAWGKVMAAGVYLDAGQIEPARPRLKAAAELDPKNRELRIHEVELMVLEGRAPDAIRRYEDLLKEFPDAELHRRIYVLAKDRDDAKARTHFDAAEALLVRILKTGEGYVLDELTRLYADSGLSADEAREKAAAHLPS